MITGAAFCPHPPALVPAIAQGAAAELASLRAACRRAVIAVAAISDHLVVLGAGDRTFIHSPSAVGTFAGLGVDLRAGLLPGASGPLELPLSLTVGAELVADAIGDALPRTAVSVAPGDVRLAAEWLPTDSARVGLIVMGDGSARRSTAAPGYLDERAVPFDDAVAEALRRGDAYALDDLDTALAADLLAAGAPAWQAAGAILRNARFDAELLAYEAPFGVGYFVASWLTRA